jgi:hypothetical protein
MIKQEEIDQEPNFYEKLKEYFGTTPREKVLEDWNKSAHLDNVGPTVDEFIENSAKERLKDAAEEYTNKFYSGYAFKESLNPIFIDGVKSDIARDYWYEKFQNEVEEKTLHAMISIMQEYSIIDEASILQFHKEWVEQFKNK